MSAIGRSLLRGNVNRGLKMMSATERCPLQSIRYIEVEKAFLRKVSVVERCPLHSMPTIGRFHCNYMFYSVIFQNTVNSSLMKELIVFSNITE